MGYKWKRTLKERIENKIMPEPMSGCWLWIGFIESAGGYGVINVDKKIVKAHRVSYSIYKGPIADGLHVCHHCDVRSCVNPDHLFLGTNEDNMNDMYKKGRGRKVGGNESHFSKLTDEDVITILKSNKKSSELANEFKVTKTNINYIKRGITWKHISRELKS